MTVPSDSKGLSAEFRGYVIRALEGIDKDLDEIQTRCHNHEAFFKEVNDKVNELTTKFKILDFKTKLVIFVMGAVGGLMGQALKYLVGNFLK